MGTTRLTKREKIEVLCEALQQEAGGKVLSVKAMRLIVGKTLDVVARQSYYNNLDFMELTGAVEKVEKIGVYVLPPSGGQIDAVEDSASDVGED